MTQLTGQGAEVVNRLLELGATTADIRVPTGAGAIPFVLVPHGFKVESLESYLAPQRIREAPRMLEAGSFCDYVNRFKSADTVIFADVTDEGASFLAVLDYHSPARVLVVTEPAEAGDPEKLHAANTERAAYCSHRVLFETIRTKEWTDWMGANGKRMEQLAFATFLEDNLPLFVNPAGAALLELVTTLHGKSEARFNQGLRTQSGAVKLTFDEEVVLKGGGGTTQSGEIEMPQFLKAGIAPFQGAPKYEVLARFKYRIENRKLVLWYETVAPHVIVRDAVLDILKLINEKTKILPFIGRHKAS